MKAEYQVTGMTCGHCIKHITEEVTAINGVNKVEISLEKRLMVVDSDKEISFNEIKEAVSEAGDYSVSRA